MKAIIINKIDTDYTATDQMSSVIYYSDDGNITQTVKNNYIYYDLKAQEVYWVSNKHKLINMQGKIRFFSPNGNNIEFLEE